MKLIRTQLVLLCALAALVAVGTSARLLAHHSQSQFEPELTISIEGTLTQGELGQPAHAVRH